MIVLLYSFQDRFDCKNMQRVINKSSISWLLGVVAISIVIVTPIIVINNESTQTAVVALICALLAAVFTLGILSEMKKILGNNWRKAFPVTIGFVYLLGSGLIPITYLLPTTAENYWRYRLFLMLLLLPIIYFSLFLYRKFSNKKTHEV